MIADKWNKNYSSDEYFYGKEPNKFLKNSIKNLITTGKVLCLAEGEGRNAVYLAKLGFDVSAIDISCEGINKGKKLAHENGVKNITWICSDLDSFDLGTQKWDVIVAIFMHLEEPLRSKIFSKIPIALKNNGYFIGEFYSKKQISYNTGGPKDLNLLYDLVEIKNYFSKAKELSCNCLERDIREGIGHNGVGSVVQVLAYFNT